MIWQFGLVQMAPPLLLSTNRLSSWEVDVSQNQDAAEVPSHPRRKTTSLPMKPRRKCNAIDEDGSTQYDDSNLAVFIRLRTPAAYHGQSDGRSSWLECRPLSKALALTMSGVTALSVVGDDMGGGDTASG